MDWYKGEELLEDVGHVVIVDEEDGETFTLALEEASAEDSGMYKCVAKNKAGTVSCSAKLAVTSEKPGELTDKEAGQETASEMIKPQHVDEVSTQPMPGEALNLTIDGDSMTIHSPDDTVSKKQPKTVEKSPKPEQKRTVPEQKPINPKQERIPQEKQPKSAPKKPTEDKRPKTKKTDDTQGEPGKEIKLSFDLESGLMASPETRPGQEIGKPKVKKPQVAEKKKPVPEQSKPFGQEVSFIIDNESLLMATPKILPEQEIKKEKDKKPQVVEKPKKEQVKPFETVGKPVSLIIDDGSLIMTSPEERATVKPETTSAPATMKKPTKDQKQVPKKKVEAKKEPKEQAKEKARPVQKQPKDSAPKVAPKTGKPVELHLDGSMLRVSLPAEEVIVPKDEASVESVAPELPHEEITTTLPKPHEAQPKPAPDKPPGEKTPPAVKTKPQKPAPDEDDTGKLAYTLKRDDGLPVWARRPKKDKPAKDETPAPKKIGEKSTKPSKPTSDKKGKADKPGEVAREPEKEQVKPVDEIPKPVGLEIGQSVEVLLGPDQDVPIIQLTPKVQAKQPELKPKQADVKPKRPEVKPKKPPEVKPKKSDLKPSKPKVKEAEEKPQVHEKEQKPEGKRPGVQKPLEEPVKPGKEVEFVFAINTAEVEATKPEVKPKEEKKPQEKSPGRGKAEKNVPEWARKGRAKDTPPPVKPKVKPKSTDARKTPGEVKSVEITPEITKDLAEPGVELNEGEDAQLKVTFDGSKPANVEWFKDGTKISDVPRCTSNTLGDGCELIVRNVTPRDSGTYVCVATNEAGSSMKTFQLIIEGL